MVCRENAADAESGTTSTHIAENPVGAALALPREIVARPRAITPFAFVDKDAASVL